MNLIPSIIPNQEINATGFGIVLGSTEDEPVQLGSVFWSTELSIFSTIGEPTKQRIGLESWIDCFDSITYLYIFLSVVLFTLCFMFFLSYYEYETLRNKLTRRKRRRRQQERVATKSMRLVIRKSMTGFPYILWDFFHAFIGKHVIRSPPSPPTKCLSVFFAVAIFNLVNGFFLNLVSVDMVAVFPPKSIDSLTNLMDDSEFQDRRILTAGGLWHEEVMKGSEKGSLENRLYERIKSEGRFFSNVLRPDIINEMIGYALPFTEGNDVIVIDRQLTPVIKSAVCQVVPHIRDRFHMSKDWFGERLLATIVSKTSDPSLLEWVRYKYRKVFESFLTQNLIGKLAYKLRLGQDVNFFKILHCIDGIQDAKDLPASFDINFFTPLLAPCLCMIFLALLSLSVEMVIRKISEKICQPVKKKRVEKKGNLKKIETTEVSNILTIRKAVGFDRKAFTTEDIQQTKIICLVRPKTSKL